MVPHVVQRIEQLRSQHAAATAHFQHHLTAAHQRRILQPRGNLPGQGRSKKRREFRCGHEVACRPKHLAGVAVIAQTRLVERHFHVARKAQPATVARNLGRNARRQFLADRQGLAVGHGQGRLDAGMRQGHDSTIQERSRAQRRPITCTPHATVRHHGTRSVHPFCLRRVSRRQHGCLCRHTRHRHAGIHGHTTRRARHRGGQAAGPCHCPGPGAGWLGHRRALPRFRGRGQTDCGRDSGSGSSGRGAPGRPGRCRSVPDAGAPPGGCAGPRLRAGQQRLAL